MLTVNHAALSMNPVPAASVPAAPPPPNPAGSDDCLL